MQARIDGIAKVLAHIQGWFYLITGLWPLVHMPSFIAVTGDKTDLWLVRTVGILVIAIGAALLVAGKEAPIRASVIFMAAIAAAGLACIDVIYVANGTIARVYLLDAVAETIIFVGWLTVLVKRRSITWA